MASHDQDNPGSSERDYYDAKPAGAAAPGWGLFGEWVALPDDAMSARLARNWWAIALRCLFAILFGVIAPALPAVTLLCLVLLFAAYMLLDGGFAPAKGSSPSHGSGRIEARGRSLSRFSMSIS
jgi:hypothetical protein